MILEFKLPTITPNKAETTMECFHAAVDAPLKPGAKLLDLSVDLSGNFSQDCPPISYFRVIVREPAVLRKIVMAAGQKGQVGDLIALFSTTPDEPIDQPPQRGIRFATAGIIPHDGMWTRSEH